MALNLGPSAEFMKKFGKSDSKDKGAKFTGGSRGGKTSRLAKAMKDKKK